MKKKIRKPLVNVPICEHGMLVYLELLLEFSIKIYSFLIQFSMYIIGLISRKQFL